MTNGRVDTGVPIRRLVAKKRRLREQGVILGFAGEMVATTAGCRLILCEQAMSAETAHALGLSDREATIVLSSLAEDKLNGRVRP